MTTRVGCLAVACAIRVELTSGPSLRVHAAPWLPLTSVLGPGPVRPLTGRVAVPYRTGMEQGGLCR